MINDFQIKCFLSIVRNKNFTKAAEELFIAQPGISRHISSLENELQLSLFDRTKKKVQLTEVGEIYYEAFRKINLELHQAGERARKLRANRQGHFRLGYLEGWQLHEFLPKIIQKFKQEYPGILIDVECYGIQEIRQALLQDKLDVILMLDNCMSETANIKRQTLTSVQKILLYSDYLEAADKKNLTLADFKDETFIVVSNDEAKDSDVYVRNFCMKNDFVPHIKFVKNIHSMLASVQNGLGVAFYDAWGNNIDRYGLNNISLDFYQNVCLAWEKNSTNPIISAFVNEAIFMMEKNEF